MGTVPLRPLYVSWARSEQRTGHWYLDYKLHRDTKCAILSRCVCDNVLQSKTTKLGSTKFRRVVWLKSVTG